MYCPLSVSRFITAALILVAQRREYLSNLCHTSVAQHAACRHAFSFMCLSELQQRGRLSLTMVGAIFFDLQVYPDHSQVDAIIFLAPISGFDQVLMEDKTVNRLVCLRRYS